MNPRHVAESYVGACEQSARFRKDWTLTSTTQPPGQDLVPISNTRFGRTPRQLTACKSSGCTYATIPPMAVKQTTRVQAGPSLEEQVVHVIRAGRSFLQRAVVVARDYPKRRLKVRVLSRTW